MALKHPRWRERESTPDFRVVETDVGTLLVFAPGGHLEVSYAVAEELGLALLEGSGLSEEE